MRIGILARSTGVPERTIRYYEGRGLLPEPSRTEAGYRDYDGTAVTRLSFIRTAQAAGLTLAEIGELLAIRDDGRPPCDHAVELLAARRREITETVAELERLAGEIEGLLAAAEALEASECGPDDICRVILGR